MFEFLFNEPLSVWQSAELVFASGWSLRALLLAVAAAVLCVFLSLVKLSISKWRRLFVAALQSVVLGTALLMLWQPTLSVSVIQAGENTVAYVLDTSRSMQTRDAGTATRLHSAIASLKTDAPVDNGVFDASLYALSESLEPIESLDKLPAPGNRTGLVDGLANLLDTVNEQSLAAVVLLSDGSNNMGSLSSDWWQTIKSAGVPVHTVGLGSVVIDDDIELADVTLDAVSTPDTPVSVRLRVLHGQTGTARLRITAGDELLLAEDIVLNATGHETLHDATFNSGDAGVRELEFSVTSDVAERNTINNHQPRVLMVRDGKKRILYIEGEPRWEYKFLRRAVQQHAGLEIVSLLRTSPNKFYRQGVRNADELANGFPQRREALFTYDAVIIGSLEAARLDAGQQANLRDFVSIRGGSLLMLAGRKGLADGGWGRSAIAATLPVRLSNRMSNNTYSRERAPVRLTRQGRRLNWLKLDDDPPLSQAAWHALPEVADVQSVGETKPGSMVLLTAERQGADEPLLVWQRYGQGQSYVMGSSGTWRWQMGLPADNPSHERFWQQFLTHLASNSLPRLGVDNQAPVFRDESAFTLSLTARNADYTPLASTELLVAVTAPDGQQEDIHLTPDIASPGRFTGTVNMTQNGPYGVTARLPMHGESPAGDTADQTIRVQRWWVRQSGTAEFFGAAQNRTLLERLAQETGGRFLTLADMHKLPDILAGENAALTREQRLPLWNMPFFFLLLLFGKALEWLLRLRWKRL